MDDLWTRKPSNAMAHHKAADFANGVRPFSGHPPGGQQVRAVDHRLVAQQAGFAERAG
jgi:hypothetical protein